MKRKDLSMDSIKHYANLQYHRSTILEGVRLAAFRNMDHLGRAMTAVGVSAFTEDREIVAVQDQMLRDQGMDPSPANRWLLGMATWYTWEVYLCLLFAELESYIQESKRNPSLVFGPLEEFLTHNGTVVQQMEILRHKM